MIYTIEVLTGHIPPHTFEHDFEFDPTREEVIELVRKQPISFNEGKDSVDYYPKVILGRAIIKGSTFTETEMTDFANYCLSEYRESILLNPENVLRQVTQADFHNWKERSKPCLQPQEVPLKDGLLS